MPRWNWTWEDPEAPATDAGDVPGHPPAWISAGARSPRATRAGKFAGIAAVALAVQIVFAGGSHAVHARATAARQSAVTAAAPAPGPSGSESREDRAVDAVLARMPAITEGGPRGRELALTFDDGPGPYSLRLVRTLHRLRVPATFFVIGEMERWFSRATIAQLHDGDAIGDHTETHPDLALLSPVDQRLQLLDQAAAVGQFGVPFPRLFRPPYGSFDAATLRQLHRLDMLMVLWSTDTSDYTLPGVHAIVHRALAGAHPGAIILLHDAGGNRSETIEALPAIVRGLRRRGLIPVTVPRLMLDDPPTTAPPLDRRLTGD